MTLELLSELQEAKLLEVCPYATSEYLTTLSGLEYVKKFWELQKIADFSYKNPAKPKVFVDLRKKHL